MTYFGLIDRILNSTEGSTITISEEERDMLATILSGDRRNVRILNDLLLFNRCLLEGRVVDVTVQPS